MDWRHSIKGVALAVPMAALVIVGLAIAEVGSPVSGDASRFPEVAVEVAAIPLYPDGWGPVALALNPVSHRLYVANAESDNVSVVDGASRRVIAVIPAGDSPHAVAVDASADRIYVANRASNDVTVIDGASNSVVATIPVGGAPWDVAVDPRIHRLYVTNHGSGTLSIIHGPTNLAIRTLAVGEGPTGVAVNPESGRVYVGSAGRGDVQVIDGVSNLVIASLSLATGPWAQPRDVAVDDRANRIYVALSAAGERATGGMVAILDGGSNSLIGSLAIPGPAEALAVDPDRGRVYVVSSSSERAWVVDAHTNSLTAIAGLDGLSSAVDIDPATGEVYAANSALNTVFLLSWTPGVVLSRGWTYACYFGVERAIGDALASAGDDVLAVYRLRPGGGYDRWLPGRPELSTITTLRPYEALFVLSADDAPWVQEPSTAPATGLALVPGWNSLCYAGEGKEGQAAVQEMSQEIAVVYTLISEGRWSRLIPGRPELSDLSYLASFSPLLALITLPPPPEEEVPEEEEVSEEFLALKAVLEERVASYYGDVAICVTDLQTGERICVNGDVPHRTGCTINMFALFVAVEEFQAGRANPQDWAYWIRIGIGYSSPPEVAVFLRGVAGSLDEGVRRANEMMRSWGMKDSIYGYVPFYPGANAQPNILTAKETNMVLAKLYRGELFSPEWTAYTIDRLLDIKPGLNYVLPGLLPAGVRVAHKIGYHADWDGWVYNDVGIVMFEQEGREVAYVISYFSQAMPSEYAAYSFGAQLSRIVYDWFEQHY